MKEEKKKTETEKKLNELKNQGLIEKNSIKYDKTNGIFSFEYSDGFEGGVMIHDFSDEINNSHNENTIITNSEESILETNETEIIKDDIKIGDMLVLHSFESTPYRTQYYNDKEDELEDLGLNVEVNMDVTIDDYKNIDRGYEIVCFSGHGSYYKNHPVMCTDETVTKENRKAYSPDIKQNMIVPINTTTGKYYWIYPSFFEYYYDDDSLSNSFIFSECCCFFGEFNTNTEEFADAFLNAGAKSVVGFHNSVGASYSRDLIMEIIEQLIEGESIGHSFDYARGIWGNDDEWEDLLAHKGIAVPHLKGNNSERLIETGIKNGDFEYSLTPVFWNYQGDVRIVASLGELLPKTGKKMAIITTGIGSKESEYLAGTEGSILEQTFRVPTGTKSMSFNYDVISEEPTEWIGSVYDDKFAAVITDNTGKSKQIAFESINNSEWNEIGDIDFEGGDQTTYHTGWNTATIDVSEYQGQIISVRFLTYDVGDSVYDTATIIDSVIIK